MQDVHFIEQADEAAEILKPAAEATSSSGDTEAQVTES